MAGVILLTGGSTFFNEDYTATPEDVMEGKLFLGYGSNSVQVGTKKTVSPKEKELGINETYNIEVGYHDVEQTVHQNIPLGDIEMVTPAGNGQTIQTYGKYWDNNIVINPLENFDPVNIKRGVTVGVGDQAITGNYEGFE